MKKFIVISLFICIGVVSQITVFNNIYSSKEDKQFAQLVENAVNLISKDLVLNYDEEFTVSNIDYVCFAGSVYSTTAQEITREVLPNYKYSNQLQIIKHWKKGEGSSLLMFIKRDNLIPIFISDYFFDIKFSDNFKQLENPDACYYPKNKNITINIKKQNIQNELRIENKYDRALITIK